MSQEISAPPAPAAAAAPAAAPATPPAQAPAPAPTPAPAAAPAQPASAAPAQGATLPAAVTGAQGNGAPASTSFAAVINGVAPSQATPPASQPASQPEASQQQGQPNQTAQSQEARQPDVDNLPIADWSKVDLQLGDAQVDGAMVESFGKTAMDIGLTPRAARALAQWQTSYTAEVAKRYTEEQSKALKEAWGDKLEANKRSVELLCQRVERIKGCEGFFDALQTSGGAGHAKVLQGLFAIAQALGEGSHGRFTTMGLGGTETALEGIQAAFAACRR